MKVDCQAQGGSRCSMVCRPLLTKWIRPKDQAILKLLRSMNGRTHSTIALDLVEPKTEGGGGSESHSRKSSLKISYNELSDLQTW
ncbi:hypothetical protein SERLA73DRAFT_137800, partial [Serpula lacrymans var. lacrymans S7.3]